MQLSAHILGDHFVRLEPIEPRHKAGIRRACEADRSIWKELYPTSWIGEAFEPSWTDLLARNAAGQWISFAVFSTGAAVGMTSLLAPDPANASVEIGATYYQPDARGGPVNPAAKRLLLAHAFEAGARRVQFKVDALNLRSRSAVLKLGAQQEGLLRQDRVTWTGRVRDTVYFSILAAEWPRVRDGLDRRLAGFS